MEALLPLKSRLSSLREQIDEMIAHQGVDRMRDDLADLNLQMESDGFWDDPDTAQEVSRKRATIERTLARWQEMRTAVEDLEVLVQLAQEEDADAEEAEELLGEIEAKLDALEDLAEARRVELMLAGEADHYDAILTIHPGAGGTESADWAAMLLRMYTRWAERSGFQVETLEFTPAEEAGIKSATLMVRGEYGYGYLRAEAGVHRLVRISPFDAAKRRHTSFASVFVAPDVPDDVEVTVDEKDLRVDVYRASGAGGQHVNKTSSAVRLTHIPTGIVVQCQNERSQHQNKAQAMKVLRGRLYERELARREQEMDKLVGEKAEIAWGSQIRSYVFQPYQMVKDHRTGHETGNVQAVMDGDVGPFIRAYLLRGMAGARKGTHQEPAGA
jgi:peptide chain release factor 2